MFIFKKIFGFALIPTFLFSLLVTPATLAASTPYSPDNSTKADPLGISKSLRGNFSVGEFSGAAIYNYPLKLPSGRKGLTPSVLISYNSNSSSLDNILGYQWDLNLFSIRRFNKKGVEKLYSSPDFMISSPAGSGELVPVNGGTGSFGFYGLKRETGFSRYEFKNDTSWIVTDKNGTKYTFGATAEAQQFDPANPSRIYQWMLEEIRDRNDNFIRYTYFKEGNQIYPKTIHYTGHGQADGIFEVRFLPFANGDAGAVRPDKHFSYASGFRVETNHLLKGIEIYAKGTLRRRYEISHTGVYPLVRQTIKQITETGYDASGQPTSLPPTTFEYTRSEVKWEETNLYQPSWYFESCYYGCDHGTNILMWDMTGDGLVDFEYFNTLGQRTRAVNDGKGGWNKVPGEFLGPSSSQNTSIPTFFKKALDFNGDLRTDVMRSSEMWNASRTQLSVGSEIKITNDQTFRNTITIAMGSLDANKPDNGASIADLNGDGLPDIIQSRGAYGTPDEKNTCLNVGGEACVKTGLWRIPEIIVTDNTTYQNPRQTYVQDCNLDGLADVYTGNSGSKWWLNDGKGGWVANQQCEFTGLDSNTVRYIDANGDGLVDRLEASKTITYGGYNLKNELKLNKGNSNQFLSYPNVSPFIFGTTSNTAFGDYGIRIVDLNGDRLPDIMKSIKIGDPKTGLSTVEKKVFLNKGSRPYFLKKVRTSEGGSIEMEYKPSTQYMKPDGTQANPNLPVSLMTVSKMTVTDGMGNASEVNYFYEDGHYYFNSSSDREMAGFRVLTKTDRLGFKTKTYYHQGENSIQDPLMGEFDDHISKKGQAYRTESYDNQNRLVQVTINRYEHKNISGGRTNPYLKQTVTVHYDPLLGTSRSLAKAFEYDQFGNKTLVVDYGEVQLNSEDGQFSDIGTDLIRQRSTFVQNVTDYLIGLPSSQEVKDQNNKQLSHQQFYYDNLALGQAVTGNVTKSEVWLDTTNSYLASTTDYDGYGLPIRSTNSRGFSSVVTYDTNHLFPTSQTNALGHTVSTTYDPTGLPLESTDPNGLKTKNTYDGLGRLIQATVDNKVTKTISYNDLSMPRIVHETLHNDDSIKVDSYRYSDGLGRVIQTKQEAPDNRWITVSSVYNERGNVAKNIQAYFGNGSNFETINANQLGTQFKYDSLNRVLSAKNSLGKTETDYHVWDQTIKDPNGNLKDLIYDARGQLKEVVEHNGSSQYRTRYDYDTAGNRIQITDAENNSRNFTYDSLGRRLTQTDAHQPGDVFGTWSYQYDANGNLAQKTDALSQITSYQYDGLDRLAVENSSSTPETDLVYLYDQGANAIGRLNQVAGKDYEHNLTYDLMGRVLTDEKKIDERTFAFNYTYDLMGGLKTMRYPDNFTINYSYNNAHSLDTVTDGQTVYADSFKYSPLGQIAEMTLGNGAVVKNTYPEDQLYRLTDRLGTLADGTELQHFKYQYDKVGNLMELKDTGIGENAKTVNYAYDDLYRLTSADYSQTANGEDVSMSYGYNAIGNMITKSDVGTLSYNHHNPHAVTSTDTDYFEYDLNGNMTNRNGEAMAYDYRGRLTQSPGTTYTYGEGYTRVKKNDRYYPNETYEIDANKEVKYVFAGGLKVAKLEEIFPVVEPIVDPAGGPIVEPIVEPVEGPIEEPIVGPIVEPVGEPTPAPQPVAQTTPEPSRVGTGGGGGSNNRHLAQAMITHQSLRRIPGHDSASKPRIPSNESDEFKNIQIVYKENKAIISWNPMSIPAEKFRIYRSKQPYPHRMSKHAGTLIAEIEPHHFRNHFTDKDVKKGEKYTYRVTALDENDSIIQTSIQLNPNQIFLNYGGRNKVNFRKYTDQNFNKLFLFQNDLLILGTTYDRLEWLIKPKPGVTQTQLEVKFLDCYTSSADKEICTKVDHKTLEVYVLNKPFRVSLLNKIKNKIAGWIVPPTYALGPDGETVSYYLYDHLGGIDAVLDEDGNVLERTDYLPFGGDRLRTTSEVDSDEHYGFTGKELDGETGLYYYGARYYDPLLGRFTSLDPWSGDLLNPQTLNKYSYVINNPLVFVDPTGMYIMETGEVEKGDTLSGITSELNDFYGTGYGYNDVAKINFIENPDRINIGQKIQIGTIGEDGGIWKPPVNSATINIGYWNGLNDDQQKILNYHRNFYQTNAPETTDEVLNSDLWSSDGELATHNMMGASGNISYRGRGPRIGQQAVFDSAGKLVISPENVGTFDFEKPSAFNLYDSHFTTDVLPWIRWGNSTSDRTTPQERSNTFENMFSWW